MQHDYDLNNFDQSQNDMYRAFRLNIETRGKNSRKNVFNFISFNF